LFTSKQANWIPALQSATVMSYRVLFKAIVVIEPTTSHKLIFCKNLVISSWGSGGLSIPPYF